MSENYNSKIVEPKWQKVWDDQKIFESQIDKLKVEEEN